ncbi:MAG: UDP-glucose 6-dehydrogenase [Pseudomonadota bacterium]
MRITMIGSGYVGLVSGAAFAELGWHVTCVDQSATRIAELERGIMPIYEPGLDELVARQRKAGRIAFTTNAVTAVQESDVVFLCVGTPMRRGDGHADLSDVMAAVQGIAPHLQKFTVIVAKSTVPVGTNRAIDALLTKHAKPGTFAVCSNPEFLREGAAIADFMNPDRILVGVENDRARAVMEKLYKPLTDKGVPLLITGRESAELAKYASNAFLALKISFVNEMADLCEKVGGDIGEVALAMGKDKRIGEQFLRPGPGFGGSCFPKDVSALIRTAREAEAELTLVEQLHQVNEERKIAMASRIVKALGGNVQGKRIAILGVTFKANTDDMRGAPSLVIVPILQHRGAEVVAYDPQGQKKAVAELPGIAWAKSSLEAAKGADAVVVLTEWAEFRDIDLAKLKSAMRGSFLGDYRNLYEPKVARAAGLTYDSIGRA